MALVGAGCGEDGDRSAWEITLSLSSSGGLGALQLDIVAPDAGERMGKGAGVDCEALLNATFAANFAAPRPGDFTVRVVDAADSPSDPVAPLPIVSVSDILVRKAATSGFVPHPGPS